MFWNWSRTMLAVGLTLGTFMTWRRHADRPVLRADPAQGALDASPSAGAEKSGQIRRM
jgi:hypothetical protein